MGWWGLRSRAAAVAGGLTLAGLVTLGFWSRVFTRGLVPVDGHTITFAYPGWRALRDYAGAGLLPLWNPFRNLGEPLLADPQSLAAYPPFWLLAPLESYSAFVGGWILLHSAVAGAGLFAIAQRRYGDPAAGAAAAAVGALNGFFVARLTFANHFAAAAWLPALLYFQYTRAPLALGVCLALQWLAGFPPFALLSGAALLAIASRQGRSGALCLLKGVGWALGLAALQWLPFLELLTLSTRSLVLTPELATQFSIPPGELVQQLVVPQWFGWQAELSGDPAITGFYVGIAALALALFGSWGRRELWIGTGVLACALLSLGGALPGYGELTPLRIFRFPANWLLLATAGIALLCAAGVRCIQAPALRWLAVAAVVVDLVLFAQVSRVSWAPPEFLADPPPLADKVAGPDRVYHDRPLMELWQRGVLAHEEDYRTMIAALAPSYGMAFGIQDAYSPQTLSLARARRYQERLDPDRIDDAGIGWIISVSDGATTVGVDTLTVRRNPQARPRVFAPQPTRGTIVLGSHAPGYVTAHTESSVAFQVVLAEVDYPGWRVLVDGSEAAHELYDETFIAVRVPPGSHQLEFTFWPRSFLLGLVATALTALAALVRVFARPNSENARSR